MSDIVIIPDSGTINFIPSSTIISKIEGSGNDLNISNTATSGRINISGSFFVNGNQVSYSGHSHPTDNIINFTGTVNNLISGYFDPSIVRTSGNQTINGGKIYNNIAQFNSGIYINYSPINNVSNLIFSRTLNNNPQSSNFTIIDNTYNNIIDIRNDGKISIGSNPSVPFGGFLDKVIIKGESNQTANVLNVVDSGNNRIFSIRNDGRLYCGLPINGIYPKFFIRSDNEDNISGVFRIDSRNIPGVFEIKNNGNLLIGNGIIGASSQDNVTIKGKTSDNTANSLRIVSSNNSDVLSIKNNGSIGIRTNNPTYQLHVVGSGIFTSGLFVNNSPVSLSGHSHIASNITDFNNTVNNLINVKSLSAGSGINISNSGGDYTVNINSNIDFNNQNVLIKSPHGFIDLISSNIIFDRVTRFVRIIPTGQNYTFYFAGTSITNSGTSTVRIPNANGPYYVYINSSGQLLYKTSPFNYLNEIPVSFIYFNTATDTVFCTDARHYANTNSNIVDYYNNSLGLTYYSGLELQYNINGSGNLSSDATIGLTNGTIIDIDKNININHSDIVSGLYEQKLYPTGHIPVLYRISPNYWRSNKTDNSIDFNSPTPYIRIGNIPVFNRKNNSVGLWELISVDNNHYFAYWICATTNMTRPIVSIMGQRSDEDLFSAESLNDWNSLELDGLALDNIKPIYRLIYQSNSSYTNLLGARLISVTDLKKINYRLSNNNHSLLYNLNNDDHKQYIHTNISRTINANHIFNSGITFNDSTTQTTAWTGSILSSQINDLDTQYLVKTTGNQKIYGEKSFYGSNEFSPIIDLEDNLVKIKAPNTSNKTYYFLGLDGSGLPPSDDHADRSVISRSIEQIKNDLSIVTTNTEQQISAIKTFSSGIVLNNLDMNNDLLTLTNGSFRMDGGGAFIINNSDYVNLYSSTDFINRYNSIDGQYSIIDDSQNKTQVLINSGSIYLNKPTFLGSATINGIETGPIVSYTHPDNVGAADYDIVISGQLHITRNLNQGIYNLVTESAWDSNLSPSGTLWNLDGWNNISNIVSRSYSTLYGLWGGGIGNNIVGPELIMKHVPSNRYWKVKFNSWTQSNAGGGFSYDRQEITNIIGDGNLKVMGSTDIVTNISVSGYAKVSGSVISSGLNSKYLSVSGLDLTYGGQPASILLKGYAWYGNAAGSCGIGAVFNQSGTFGSSERFFGFQGFDQNVTTYNDMCFTAGNFPQIFLKQNGNVGINTATPSYKLDVNGTANVATSLRINAQTASTIASFDASKNIVSLSTATYPSLTELSYLKGTTSAIQTQLNSKQATLTNPITGTGTISYLPKFSTSSTLTNSIIYDNGTNVGIGTTSPSTKLHVNGMISQSAIHASAGLSSDQTITQNVDTVLQLTDKDDPNNWWNATTYRFLPTVSGYYFISAQVNWDPGVGTGQLNIQLRRNGTTVAICQDIMVTGISLTQNVTAIVNLNGSSDYIDLTGYTSTTAASQIINGTADRAWTKLEAFKIS